MSDALHTISQQLSRHSPWSMSTVTSLRAWLAGLDTLELLALATVILVASQYAVKVVGMLGTAMSFAGGTAVVLRYARVSGPTWLVVTVLVVMSLLGAWLAWRSRPLTLAASRIVVVGAVLALAPNIAVFGRWALVPAVVAALILPTIGLWTVVCTLLVMALGIRSPAGAWYLWGAGAVSLQTMTDGLFGLPTRHQGRKTAGELLEAQPLGAGAVTWARALWNRGWAHVSA